MKPEWSYCEEAFTNNSSTLMEPCHGSNERGEERISASTSHLAAYAIVTEEERVIAREVWRLLAGQVPEVPALHP